MLGFNLETYFIMYNICKAVEKLNISLTCMMSLLVQDETLKMKQQSNKQYHIPKIQEKNCRKRQIVQEI